MAMGLQRAYPEFLGQGACLVVVGFSQLDVRGGAVRGDLATQS
jgi:hypothetical protein